MGTLEVQQNELIAALTFDSQRAKNRLQIILYLCYVSVFIKYSLRSAIFPHFSEGEDWI